MAKGRKERRGVMPTLDIGFECWLLGIQREKHETDGVDADHWKKEHAPTGLRLSGAMPPPLRCLSMSITVDPCHPPRYGSWSCHYWQTLPQQSAIRQEKERP